MCCTAHPFTLRVCQQCAMMNRVCWTIAEFRAKQAFLLSKQDINQIPTLSLVIGGVTKTLCWLPNVILLSLNKYGGVDGLQAAFEAKKAMALAKYNMRLLTAKPQKSIPGVCKQTSRPLDHLASFKNSAKKMYTIPRLFPVEAYLVILQHLHHII